MNTILYLGLRPETLALLQHELPDAVFQQASETTFKEAMTTLSQYDVLLLGEETGNPIRLAQEAYARDKQISIVLLNDASTHTKLKQALLFSPFVGATVQCISNETGPRMAPILEDAMQRTTQRRSFARIKSTSVYEQSFVTNPLESVRTDFTTKVLEEAPIGAVLLSGSGTLFSINNYALSLFGKSEKEVLGTIFSELFPGEVGAEVRHFLQDGYLSGHKEVFKLETSGQVQHLELSVAPVALKTAGSYMLVILNNITAAVVAQQRTQAHLEEVEKLNANLARVNADLDTFVYTASHDLKSPILNIEGLVASLEAELGPASAQVKPELDHIKRSVQRFKQTVEGLTEVSRIQRNVDEEPVQLQLTDLLEEVRLLLDREIADTGAEICLQEATDTALYLPRRTLSSILYNLVSNGIKYRSPDRKPQVQISTWHDGQHFCLSVQDNGLGIPSGNRDRVFQLFKRMHSHVPGSGVGLYIVKRLVESNGGQITLESEEGVGTLFRVQLKEHAALVKELSGADL